MQVSLPTDSDGFLTQQCPSCQQLFKLVFGEGSDKPVSYCPYCGFEGRDCWWTQPQADYIAAVATNEVLGPELKKLQRSLRNSSGGLFKINFKSDLPSVPTPPVDVDRDYGVYHFPCCNETIKVNRHDTLFCVICGNEMDVTMSESKRVFLSHKGVDKSLVTNFKDTLQALGYEPWIDDDAMPAGTSLERGLLKGMQDSCGVVFFITSSFKDEDFLETEINYAIREKRKKRDKFAIITLLFIDKSGGGAEAVPDLLKDYVWKTPQTHLEALREIIRALPVQMGPVDWREEIAGVVLKADLKPKSIELSNEAKAILLEAVDGNGTIMHLRSSGGEVIQAHGKSIIPEQDKRTIALWVGGLDDLARRGFIKALGHKGNIFEVTREGYEAADELRSPSVV